MAKKFRIATEGATVDGRKIERSWIEQMAKNYDPKVYTARLNCEHIRGVVPGMFNALGDVVALEAKEEGGKMRLYAEISPTAELVELSQKKQKVFTSIEVREQFADTGEAYLVGLACTDDPASLGTDRLEFSRKRSGNHFGDVEEITFDFSDADVKGFDGLIGKMTAAFTAITDALKPKEEPKPEAKPEAAAGLDASAFSKAMADMGTAVTAAIADVSAKFTAELAAQKAEFSALKADLASTEGGTPKRPAAAGTGTFSKTDC